MRAPTILATVVFLLIVAVLNLPGSVEAQAASKIPRIGVLAERSPPDPMLEALLEGLRDLGYVEGQNIVIERRYGQGTVDRYPELIADLLGLKIDVLVVGGRLLRGPPRLQLHPCQSCSRRSAIQLLQVSWRAFPIQPEMRPDSPISSPS